MIFENSSFKVIFRQNIRNSTKWSVKCGSRFLQAAALKCPNYYCHLIRHKYEKPNKWPKLKEEFNLTEETVSEAFLLPIRVTYEPCLRSFQYKVLHSILYMNDLLYKIKYVSSPLCSLCQQTTMSYFFIAFFENPFGTKLWRKF